MKSPEKSRLQPISPLSMKIDEVLLTPLPYDVDYNTIKKCLLEELDKGVSNLNDKVSKVQHEFKETYSRLKEISTTN
jgi:hypothetical protein